MAISANSYGSVAEVEALSGRYTNDSGKYSSTTTPTLAEVERFLDRVSAMVNICLAKHGFAIPVSQETIKLALDEFTVQQSTLLCHAANGAGPFTPNSEELRDVRQKSPFSIISKDACQFIEDNLAAFVQLGLESAKDTTFGLNYRSTDDSGDPIEPIFQRKQFGNNNIDWDIE